MRVNYVKYYCVLVFFIYSFGTSSLNAGQPFSPIESPDGLYLVSKARVVQIKSTDQNEGNYEYRAYVVEVKNTKYTQYKVGELVERGYWVPSTQQFYWQGWGKTGSGHKCDKWSESNWTPQFVSVNAILSGKKVQVWKEGDNFPANRKFKPFCVNAQINSRTCKMHSCLEWLRTASFSSDSYLVENRDNALMIHDSLQ